MKTSLGRCSIRRVSPPRHVLVCGAGVVGASVAYFLARRGVAVTVVERSGVACAASGKSGGFLALDGRDGAPIGTLARARLALHAELAKELGTDYGYRRMDTFMLAARERGALTGGHRVAAPPWLDGSGVVTATLGSTETTAQVTPARFTGALLDAAQARGAKLHLGVVEDVARRDGAAAGVVTADGQTLEGDAVVLAAAPGGGPLAAVSGRRRATAGPRHGPAARGAGRRRAGPPARPGPLPPRRPRGERGPRRAATRPVPGPMARTTASPSSVWPSAV